MEAGLPAGFSSDVMQVASFVAEDRVGDQLFVRRIVFGLSPIHEEVVLRIKKSGHVVVDIGDQALKFPKLLKESALHHQNFFAVVFGHLATS